MGGGPSQFQQYWEIQQRTARAFAGAEAIDVWSSLDEHGGDDLLVDSNHLSRAGNLVLARLILGPIGRELGLAPSEQVLELTRGAGPGARRGGEAPRGPRMRGKRPGPRQPGPPPGRQRKGGGRH